MSQHLNIFSFGVIEGNLSLLQINVTPKTPNLPSFWALSRERKVQLTCSWSHFVGLIETQPMEPFAKFSNAIKILDKHLSSKFG